MIKKEKPDIVAFFTQESISGTDDHYQHHLMKKIEGIRNTQLEYRIVSKVDATTKKNSRYASLQSNDKKPFNVRTRIYVNNKTVYFGFSNKNFSKSVSENIQNNSIYNEKIAIQSTYLNSIHTQKFKFIKYGYRRLRFSRNGEGYILSNMIIERNDQTKHSNKHDNYNKHNYIFCNYDTDNTDILEKMIMQKNIPLGINVSIYLITKNFISNVEIKSVNDNSQKIGKYKINGNSKSIVKDLNGEFLKLNGSKFKKINKNDKYLILISDMEGCFATNQSRILCSNEFFDSLDTFLFNGNSVAFLGDYFDKGDLVENTINRIIELYEKYSITLRNKDFGKVYIILGNRDLNKLRIPYEVQDDIIKQSSNKNQLWSDWIDFYKEFYENTSDKKKLLEIILQKSMGASGSYDWIAPLLDIKESNHSKISFKNNLKKLFLYGKIVIYEKEFKILLSHSGGIDTFPYINNLTDYYQNILNELNLKIKEDLKNNNNNYKYFEYIEFCRNKLSEVPIKNYLNNNTSSFVNSISVVNTILDNLKQATKNFTLFNKKSLIAEYFLIQAMGLKPNAGNPFLSFIDSRDHNGCSGPKIYQEPKLIQYKKSLNFLKNNGINFVASGHVPHCAPVPLIYRRTDCDNVAFILNDTSNGYRKANINSVNKIPLSFVRSNKKNNQNVEYSVGVGFLYNNTISTVLPSNGISESLHNFSFMIGEWNIDDNNIFPYFDGTLYNNLNSSVIYPSGKLQFTTKAKNTKINPFSPAIGVT